MALEEYKNCVNWWLKQKMTWSARVHKRLATDFDKLLSGLPVVAQRRAAQLMANYDLTAWPKMCTEQQLLINLYLLDVMDRTIPRQSFSSPSLDIGSADWNYLPALAAFSGTTWLGVELDAHQRYLDFTTRRGQAEYMMEFYPGSRYYCGSVMDIHDTFDLITWLLPYVLIEPLHAAGLPAHFFDPQVIFQHVWQRLNVGGMLFIINQGEQEAAAQQELFAALNVQTGGAVELTSCFSVFKKPRYAWCVTREV